MCRFDRHITVLFPTLLRRRCMYRRHIPIHAGVATVADTARYTAFHAFAYALQVSADTSRYTAFHAFAYALQVSADTARYTAFHAFAYALQVSADTSRRRHSPIHCFHAFAYALQVSSIHHIPIHFFCVARAGAMYLMTVQTAMCR